MELQGAKALVTGGSEGIGYGIAEAMAAAGCEVVITGRRKEMLADAASKLGIGWIRGDVGDEEDVRDTVAEFVERHGRIDLLVNNAGWGYFAPLTEMNFDTFRELYRTNVFGAFLMTREVARHMVAQEAGHIVNISSPSGLKGHRGGTAYSSSKFALKGMTECWRDELRRHNIRVMLVNPSEVQTPFGSKAGYRQEVSERKLRPREIADSILGALRMDDRGFIPEFSIFATNPF